MNRTEERHKKRKQEQDLKIKELESKGFTISRQEYRKKRNIANKKCSYNKAQEEMVDRQETTEAALKVYRRLLPTLLKNLSKIKDPRQTKKTKHSLTVLMIYGILMFVYNMSSLRNANKEISSPIFFDNMKAMFPEFETMPHSDTLSRLLEKIKVEEIEESMLVLFEELIKKKKFKNHLINKRYVIAIDGTQKFMRTEKWSQECLERHVGKEKQEQYYVYVLEAVVIFDNGITLPLMSEFLNNDEYKDVSSDKQDCERKAFYRFSKKIKARFPKLKIAVTMDGLYACGPVIKICRDYGWDFMLVFKEGSMKDTWKEAMGLIRLTPENTIKYNCGARNQVYRWINDVEYTYGDNGRKKTILHVVTCEETWEETSRTTGKIESKSTRYIWISGKELTKSNVENRCIKIGRYRWKIENNFLVVKHQGYQYEHCFSYNWNAMVGFHNLMKIGRFINVLLVNSEFLAEKVDGLGIRGLITFIFKACTGYMLDMVRLSAISKDDSYQWRLVRQ
ncbi:transposase family protein [Clostridium sp. FP2]|uniref:transposase family protein n=2 Tax=Clostridium sp. FP2 TaxID=2724481 RepID=UPI001CCF16AE|nr:transposase family protein [Clostridium sp. FP2]MBZ9623767.1 transposase family protein [Clostridium sp. FP2]